MSGRRVPWWIFVAAVTYVGHFGLLFFIDLRGAEKTGISMQWGRGPLLVTGINANSPGARSGLRPGDRIRAIDGLTIATYWHYLRVVAPSIRPGVPVKLDVVRGEAPIQLILTCNPLTWKSWREQTMTIHLLHSIDGLFLLCLALAIAFKRPHDPVAVTGAAFLAEASITAFILRELPGLFPFLRDMPILAWFLTAPRYMQSCGAILTTFAALFPRPYFQSRWPLVALWIPAVLIAPANAYYSVYMPLWNPADASHTVDIRVVAPVVIFYLSLSVVIFVLNYRRLKDVNERRRARLVTVGTVCATVIFMPRIVMLLPWGPFPRLSSEFEDSGVATALAIGGFALPVSFSYAILRQRVFDIGFLLRIGLQYALARGAVAGLLAVVALMPMADLILHGDQPLLAIVRQRAWLYLGAGGIAALLHFRRQAWMSALDRRFFREQYNAQRLLREVAEESRQAESLEGVAPRVVEQVNAALHPEFIALLLRRPHDASFRTLAVSGSIKLMFRSESKLIGMLRLLNRPLEVAASETGWLQQQLPPDESELLRESKLELLIPIATGERRAEALIAVGGKRSEEPYSREDHDLLSAIAANLSMLLDRASSRSQPVEAIEEQSTIAMPAFSMVLSGRYVLERRLGGGGMGEVYLATDNALERHVAVKIMRDDLAGTSGAAERFRREARMAASFTHPNVVTIHDFGVHAGTRAFLVMEVLDGVTLRERIRRSGRLLPPDACDVLRGVCTGVAAAHELLLLHRDLKPENIFLTRQAVVKVLDFGVAKSLALAESLSAGGTGVGQLVGTVRYMSPEQLRGEPAKASWDLWSLAVVAYETLTGAYPFEASSAADWQQVVLSGQFTPTGGHVADAPAVWDEFFKRTFAVDPEKRIKSAMSFYGEFERVAPVRR